MSGRNNKIFCSDCNIEFKEPESLNIRTELEVPIKCYNCNNKKERNYKMEQLNKVHTDMLKSLENFQVGFEDSLKGTEMKLLSEITDKFSQNEKSMKMQYDFFREENKKLENRLNFLESKFEKIDLMNGFSEAAERNLPKFQESLHVTTNGEESIKRKVINSIYFKVGVVLIVVLALVSAGIIILKNQSQTTEIVELPMNFTQRYYSRGDWLSNEWSTKSKDLLYRPAKYVVVAHTASSSCSSESTCAAIMRHLQASDIEGSFGDIRYSFLIGGDGYIYEGRGWGKYGNHTKGFNCDSVGLAFIGDFVYNIPNDQMLDAFHILVEEGLRVGEIDVNYKLFAQLQLIPTFSPGQQLHERMKKWEHWGSLKVEDQLCDKNDI